MNRRNFFGTLAAVALRRVPARPRPRPWTGASTITAAELNAQFDEIYAHQAGVIQVDGPLDEHFRRLVREAMGVHDD